MPFERSLNKYGTDYGKTAHNKGLSAMLASEYIMIDISLFSCSSIFTNITQLWNLPAGRQVYPHLSIFNQQQYRAEARPNVPKSMPKSNIIYVRYGLVTQNTNTAESPGRYGQF
jgi:hypothetical protein